MHRILIPAAFFAVSATVHAQELKFSNLDSLFSYAGKHSAVMETGRQQALLAGWMKAAALASTLNFRNQVSFSLTDNTQLPVNFLPAEAFGGAAGTFKEVRFGQQYIGNATVTPQIDILNLASWEKVTSAGIYKDLTGVNNLVGKKSLYESIAAAWYNIIALREQVRLLQENLRKADTLLAMVQSKFALGLVRQQDVNDATANKLVLEDRLTQSQLTLNQQYLGIHALCGIPENQTVVIEERFGEDLSFPAGLSAVSDLQLRSSALHLSLARSDLRYNRLSQFPSVSLLLNYAGQQNSNEMFFDPQARWINSSYVAARLSFNIPDVNKAFLARNSQINYRIALTNYEQMKIQNAVSNRQLQMDYEKAFSQFGANKRILELKNENYRMAFEQYGQGILPFDKLLLAFTEMVNSRVNYINAAANLNYQKTKIDLNNSLLFK